MPIYDSDEIVKEYVLKSEHDAILMLRELRYLRRKDQSLFKRVAQRVDNPKNVVTEVQLEINAILFKKEDKESSDYLKVRMLHLDDFRILVFFHTRKMDRNYYHYKYDWGECEGDQEVCREILRRVSLYSKRYRFEERISH